MHQFIALTMYCVMFNMSLLCMLATLSGLCIVIVANASTQSTTSSSSALQRSLPDLQVERCLTGDADCTTNTTACCSGICYMDKGQGILRCSPWSAAEVQALDRDITDHEHAKDDQLHEIEGRQLLDKMLYEVVR
ncbi:hypothetical protein ACN47E_008686 [Coniothyrium glycines]